MKGSGYVLPVIVASQFFCTSLWFAGNAIVPDIIANFHPVKDFLAHLTSAVQFGFITGTFVFALFAISDRFSPSVVFFVSAILAGILNLGIAINDLSSTGLLLFRFLTGFFIAGVYPVGMKIASDYYQKGLGKSLGFLVGALVLGTAFPHLLRSATINFSWKYVVYSTTILSALGGLCVLLLLPDGPYRKSGKKLNFAGFIKGFTHQNFRTVSFGYFGHMWELYTFWAFVPVMLGAYNKHYPGTNLNVSLLSFLIIALGGLACVFSGILSQYFGAKKVATMALLLSCLCCIASPLFLFSDSPVLLIIFLIFWGLVVIADSPLFSTLVAQSSPEESRGSSLTIVNCIGFSITIISIQFIGTLSAIVNAQYIYMFLAIGPILGLVSLLKKQKQIPTRSSVDV